MTTPSTPNSFANALPELNEEYKARLLEASSRASELYGNFAKHEPIEVGSVWQHRNGNRYQVEQLTNTSALHNKDKYPPTVVYRGLNGQAWSRPVHDWHRSMSLVHTPITRVLSSGDWFSQYAKDALATAAKVSNTGAEAVIDFVLELAKKESTHDAFSFMRWWKDGEFEKLRRVFPEAPSTVYADSAQFTKSPGEQNVPAHLRCDPQVIKVKNDTVLYWPTTQGWKVIGSGKSNRGADKLRAFLDKHGCAVELQTVPENNDAKAARWFDVLQKCASMLDVPDNESIPSGVLRRVQELTEQPVGDA